MANRGKLLQVEAEYVSVQIAEQLTSRSAWSWRKDAYARRVASVKMGRQLLIPRSEIDRVMRENMRPAVESPEVVHDSL